MSRLAFTLADEPVRELALRALIMAPLLSRIEIKGPARSNDQNARLHRREQKIAKIGKVK